VALDGPRRTTTASEVAIMVVNLRQQEYQTISESENPTPRGLSGRTGVISGKKGRNQASSASRFVSTSYEMIRRSCKEVPFTENAL